MPTHTIASRAEWLEARRVLLAKEKALTRAHDRLMEERRALPWVLVEKDYVFEGSDGRATLAELFAGRSQLIVKHFMMGPDWQEGCTGCSFGADHVDAALTHLENHDVTLVAVSRAPYARIAPFHRRMGWRFRWVSSFGSDFNFDFNVSFSPEQAATGKVFYNFAESDYQMDEMSGMSVFTRDEAGAIYHTYSVHARGDEGVLATYALLDMTPKGRNETGPHHNLMDWVKHHDRYGATPAGGGCHG